MNRTLTLVAGLGLAIACAPIAASPVFAAPGVIEVAQAAKVDMTMRASKLIGMTVYNDTNTAVGKVEEVLVASGGKEPFAVLSVGSFLGTDKLVSVPLSHLHLAAGRVDMPTATKAHLTEMPVFSYTSLNGGGG